MRCCYHDQPVPSGSQEFPCHSDSRSPQRKGRSDSLSCNVTSPKALVNDEQKKLKRSGSIDSQASLNSTSLRRSGSCDSRASKAERSSFDSLWGKPRLTETDKTMLKLKGKVLLKRQASRTENDGRDQMMDEIHSFLVNGGRSDRRRNSEPSRQVSPTSPTSPAALSSTSGSSPVVKATSWKRHLPSFASSVTSLNGMRTRRYSL